MRGLAWGRLLPSLPAVTALVLLVVLQAVVQMARKGLRLDGARAHDEAPSLPPWMRRAALARQR